MGSRSTLVCATAFVALALVAPLARTVNRTFELGGPNGWRTIGRTRDMIRQGDRLTENAIPAKDGSPKAQARTLVLRDGTQIANYDRWDQTLPGAPSFAREQ